MILVIYQLVYYLSLHKLSIARAVATAGSTIERTGSFVPNLLCNTTYRKTRSSGAETSMVKHARSLLSATTLPTTSPSIKWTSTANSLYPSDAPRTTKVPFSSLTAEPTNPFTYLSSQKPSPVSTTYPSNLPSLKPSNGRAASNLFPSTSTTNQPSPTPSKAPILLPSSSPSDRSSNAPSLSPTATPSFGPSLEPSLYPTLTPSLCPSNAPTVTPSYGPSNQPSPPPTNSPSLRPSYAPSFPPTVAPSLGPSNAPSQSPTIKPSFGPSKAPSPPPTTAPSLWPSISPSAFPSFAPSFKPSTKPSFGPSASPTYTPSILPSTNPTSFPSTLPTVNPSLRPSTSTYSPSITHSPTVSMTSLSPTLLRNNSTSNQNSQTMYSSSEFFTVFIAVASALLLWCLVVSACWCYIAKRDRNIKKADTLISELDKAFIMKPFDSNTNFTSKSAVNVQEKTTTTTATTAAIAGSNPTTDTFAQKEACGGPNTPADYPAATEANVGPNASLNEAASAAVAADAARTMLLEGDLAWGIARAYSEERRNGSMHTNKSDRSSYCRDNDQSTFTGSNPYYSPNTSRKPSIDDVPPGGLSATSSMRASAALTSEEYSQDNTASKHNNDVFSGMNPYHSLPHSRKPSVDSVEQSSVRRRLRSTSSAASIEESSSHTIFTNETTAQGTKARRMSNPAKFNKNPLTEHNSKASGDSSSSKTPVVNTPSASQPNFPPASNIHPSTKVTDTQVDLTSKPPKQADATRLGKNPFLARRGRANTFDSTGGYGTNTSSPRTLV